MAGRLAEELVRRGHEVHALFNPRVYEYFRGRLRESTTDCSATSSVIMHSYKPSMGHLDSALALSVGYWARAKKEAEELCTSIAPDVVHWHNSKGFIGLPFSAPKALSLYTAHDYYAVCPRSNLLRPHGSICDRSRFCQMCLIRWRRMPQLWRLGRRTTLEIPRNIRIICPSEFMARKLTCSGFNEHTVIRNFVPDPGRPTFDRAVNRKAIVYVGLMEPHKGPETLLNAFIASSRSHGFELYLIGEGSLRPRLSKRVSESGLSARVFVPGYLPTMQLERILRTATVFAIPSEWYENAPLAALEALGQGIVVLGSNIGGLPEILTPDSGASLFKAGDSEELADAIVRLWEESDMLGSRRRLARHAYENRFTPAIHLRQYLDMISNSSRQ